MRFSPDGMINEERTVVMQVEVIIPWLDLGLKYTVLMFGMYYLFIKCVSEKRDYSVYFAAGFFSAAMGISMIWIRMPISPLHLPLMLMYLTLTNCLLFRNEPLPDNRQRRKWSLSEIMTLSLLCFTFCQAIFFLTGFIWSVMLSFVYEKLIPVSHHTVNDFLGDVPVHIVVYLLMIASMWFVIRMAANMKRLRKGLMTIVERRSGDIGIMLSVLLLVLGILFCGVGIGREHIILGSILLIPIILFGVIMIFWIKREIMEEYIRQLLERNAEWMIKSLSEKDEVIAGLMADNGRMADIMERDNQLLTILNDSVRSGASPEEIASAAEAIERVYSGRLEAVGAAGVQEAEFNHIGIGSVDAILEYMAKVARGGGIDFSVEVSSEAGALLSDEIDCLEFSTMLADLTENALISARSAGTAAVAVNIVRRGDNCCLEVLDSGEKFDEEVLRHMGKRRITTHSGEGGSGIGMMNLIRILHHNGAGLIIEEFPEGERYTKSVRVIFDGSESMKLITNRFDGAHSRLKHNRFGRFEVCRR